MSSNDVIERLSTAPGVDELVKATTTTVGDLIRFGSSITTQSDGWGDGESACALGAAGLAYEALRRK